MTTKDLTPTDAPDPGRVVVLSTRNDYPVLSNREVADSLIEAITENVGGGLAPSDLSRWKGAGPGLEQFVNVDTGEVRPSIEGVLVGWAKSRSYWESPDAMTGTPPNCASIDALTGVGVRWQGDPQGAHTCLACPLSQFESAAKGSGQACKEFRQLLLLEPGHSLPTLIRVPPTSIKTFTRYMTAGLVTYGLPYFRVVTRISLKATKTEAGMDVAVYQFEPIAELPADMLTAARGVKRALAAGWVPTPVGIDAGPTGDPEPF